MTPPYFWAKTTADNQLGISVKAHSQNVGWVTQRLAQRFPTILQHFGLTADEAAALAALHDIGKIAQGFQAKSDRWLQIHDLIKQGKRWREKTRVSNHSRISQFSIERRLLTEGKSLLWAYVVGAHHGRPEKFTGTALDPDWGMGIGDEEWEGWRQELIQELLGQFGPLPSLMLDDHHPALWWVAGLVSVADWLGSNEEVFSIAQEVPPEAYRERQAKIAVDCLGLGTPVVRHGLEFHDLFSLNPDGKTIPNALQLATYEYIREPGVYTIEAPMGMGKTEAALWAAYRLITEGKASGIYFALPTQVTSNRIYERVDTFVHNILQEDGESRVRLIHGSSWLHEQLFHPTFSGVSHLNAAESNMRSARDWFASAKRAILSPFGVGTVDQALLATLAVKHFFVRRFGLAGKVVIIDEVHSYDVYTGALIRKLCSCLASLGCTVILLSATLTARRRQLLLDPTCRVLDPTCAEVQEEQYPLLSGALSTGALLAPKPVTPPPHRTVHLRRVGQNAAFDGALAAARQGACVLWICNTIGMAQAIYRQLQKSLSANDIQVGLLHSRYPFYRRDELERDWMARLGKSNTTRTGCVLVATQVVEQSVDLDADLLITQLAPTDMMLQRIGRLWRHNRPVRNYARPEAWIVVPEASLDELRAMGKEEVVQALKPSSNVYQPYVLLRSFQEWHAHDSIEVPSDIRRLIECTYCVRDDDPEIWQELFGDQLGGQYSLMSIADTNANVWQQLLNDTEGKRTTRYEEYGVVPIILAQNWDGVRGTLLQGEMITLGDAQYSLATAKAIHRNLVKLPEWVVNSEALKCPAERYVYGGHAIAVVGSDGVLDCPGVKPGHRLRYRNTLGVLIESTATEDSVHLDESLF